MNPDLPKRLLQAGQLAIDRLPPFFLWAFRTPRVSRGGTRVTGAGKALETTAGTLM